MKAANSHGSLVRAHTFDSGRAGPRLIVLGAVHGNETCGTRAIERVVTEVSDGLFDIVAGRVTFVPVTNRLAYERGTRNGDRNLNRNLLPSAHPQDNEDRIANELCPLLAAHDVLLDLHSFQSPGDPFVMLGPENNVGSLEPFTRAREEEVLARCLGVRRAADGWLHTYAAGARRRGGATQYGRGTTELMRSLGGYGVTLECGQHADAGALKVAYQAIRRTLAQLRMVTAEPPPPTRNMEMLRLCEVVDRLSGADSFASSWKSFDAVKRGDLIGWRADGRDVLAPGDGFIVFPNANADAGTEWFYFARRHARLSDM